ncbi:MAG: flavodoxin family protein [Candidatus Riflebacteria bacterium]|nr:flavodoxin family protein [Candidatus Riflebacteria bacterium]
MKKFISFLGSPHKNGNTGTIMKQIIEGIKSQKAEVTEYHLNSLNVKGCQACMFCRKNRWCSVKDDIKNVFEDITNSDGIVLGSPIYMYGMTGQTKLLLDRFYCFLNDDFSHRLGDGKKTITVFTQGNPNEKAFVPYFNSVKDILKNLGFLVEHNIVGCGFMGHEKAIENKGLLEGAYKIGVEFAR